jgi:hypothetical protein
MPRMARIMILGLPYHITFGADAEEDMRLLRSATTLGRPLGSPSFLERLENLTGLRLFVGKPVRPKKDREGE